jgi:elongation factor G
VDSLADLYLGDEEIGEEQLVAAIREACLAGAVVPVLAGSSLKNVGVQSLLDAVIDFLPSPKDRPPAVGHDPETGEEERRAPEPEAPFSALIFKVVTSAQADTHYLRIYSGRLPIGERCLNPRTGVRLRLRRLLRMHADRGEVVEEAVAGDILAAVGLKDVVTGDTLCALDRPLSYEPIHFPETVVSVAVEARSTSDRDRLMEVIARMAREDPTFHYKVDEETGQLILSGMGELHLEVIGRTMEREYNVRAKFGSPRVSYRETVTAPVEAEGVFDKKVGEQQLFARVRLRVEPRPRQVPLRQVAPVEVEDALPAGTPAELRREAREVVLGGCEGGGAYGYPVVDARIHLLGLEVDEAPDPSLPVGAAAAAALREALQQAEAAVLEPIMRLEVRVPDDFLGAVMKDLSARRSTIEETGALRRSSFVRGTVPLAEMFGYSTELRSLTQGRATFSLEPFDYRLLPPNLTERNHVRF